MDLFEYSSRKAAAPARPLAERMRPRTLDEVVGQEQITGPGAPIRRAIEDDRIFSMILWGPPGCGKTTLARIVAAETDSYFVEFSAVLSGVKDIRAVISEAKNQLNLHHRRTILFVDEIHRFNKAQQDAFLQHVENGLITLIGATTENPSFEVIPALLSRCRVVTLGALSLEDMKIVIDRAIGDHENGYGDLGITLDSKARDYLAAIADGDVRSALNALEIVGTMAAKTAEDHTADGRTVSLAMLEKSLQKKALLYDKAGEQHYNLISALHKSLRGSDPDAAIYWLTRMLEAGEDPLFIARRMVRFASEDIGNADPFALTVAMDAMEAFRFLGHPEGDLSLVQAAAYLATAPKSNSLYRAHKAARQTVAETGSLPVPLHIRNAPTGLMKDLGYGSGYKYAHDYAEGFVEQAYLPDELKGKRFYEPSDRGFEKTIKQRLDKWRRMMGKKGAPIE
jgi:putative ATPase